jgi:hypothetical protein
MAILKSFGNTLVSNEELNEKISSGALDQFISDTTADAFIEFSTGSVSKKDIEDNSKQVVPGFTEIDLGKPLSIEILSMYTGDAPGKIFGKPDMLVVTAVKSFDVFDAAPRAINQMYENIQDNQLLTPKALNEGTPLVYYSPATENSTIFCSYEMIVDTFNEDTFKQMGALLSSAGGLPVFAPASAYLLAGSVLMKIAGNLGKALIESKPFLSESLNLRFDTPGMLKATSGQKVIYRGNKADHFSGYKISRIEEAGHQGKVALTHKTTGELYKGSEPYMIVNIDGRTRTDISNFSPKLASASLIEKFYGTDKSGQVTESLEEAMSLFNDMKYRTKVERLKKSQTNLDQDSAEFKKIQKLIDACKMNIENDLLKNGL